MNWNDLTYVLALHREGTVLAAATSLRVARTTVTRRLNALEDELGVRLFDRTSDGFVPTAAGRELVVVAEQTEDEMLAVEARVRGRDAELRGDLRVSTVDVLTVAFDSAFIGFARRFPHVQLSIETTRARVSLSRREADVALRLSNAPPEHLIGWKVGYVQFAVYAAKTLVEELGTTSLAAYPWIGWDGGENLNWFQGWLQDNAPGARIVLRLSDRGLLMSHAVGSGMGAQILPCIVGDRDSRMARIAPLDDVFRLDLWLLTLPELRNNSRIRAFVHHMREAIGDAQADLAGLSTKVAGPLK